jgi:hypothetical protein
VRRPRVTMLTSHRIAIAGEAPDIASDVITAAPVAFEAQMHYVAARFAVLPFDAVVRTLRWEGDPPTGT